MALDNYEAILKLFAGTTDAITDRQAVVDGGPDKTKWIKDGDGISRHVTLAEGTWVFTADKWKIFTIRFDDTVKTGGETTTGGYYNNISVTSPVKETTTNYSFDYVLGYRVNHDWFNNKSAEWLKFSSTPTDYLERIGAWGDTDTTSSKSLEAASVAIAGMTTLMETWSGEFTKWAGELNAKGSQLQGTAAGVLKQQLTYFAEQMKIVQNELVDSKAQANLLSNAKTLATTAKQLAADIDTWALTNTPRASLDKVFQTDVLDKLQAPPTLGHKEFEEFKASGYTKVMLDYSSTGYGDPNLPEFWTKLLANAHTDWLNRVKELDATLAKAMPALDTAYLATVKDLPDAAFRTPKPITGPETVNGPGSGTQEQIDEITAEAQAAIDKANKERDEAIAKFEAETKAAIEKANAERDEAIAKAQAEAEKAAAEAAEAQAEANARADAAIKLAQDQANQESQANNERQAEAEAQAQAQILKANEQAQKQADEARLQAEEAAARADQAIVEANTRAQEQIAQIQAQADNQAQQANAQAQSQLEQIQAQIGAMGGSAFARVPPGSKVTTNGQLLGPDGQPVLGDDGLPLTVPSGTVVGPNGQLLGPNGLPISSSSSVVRGGASLFGPEGTESVIGPNGQVMTDTDGQPITVPAGSTLNPDGTVTGPNGQLITGANGQPLTVPQGSALVPNNDFGNAGRPITSSGAEFGSPEEILGPDGQVVTGANGRPITVPDGSVVNANGTITGPDGRAVTGANGQPITVPTGSTLVSTTTVTGPDGLVVTDADGQAVTVPEGSVVNPDGSITGPKGQPILGVDGKPIDVPDGSTVTANVPGSAEGSAPQQILGPDGQPVEGANGRAILVPDGSVLNANGTITGPDGEVITGANGQPITAPTGSELVDTTTVTAATGQVVTDANGQPITVPQGSTVNADGSIIGPEGEVITGPGGTPVTVPDGSTLTNTAANARLNPESFTQSGLIGPDGQPILTGPDGTPINIPAGAVPSASLSTGALGGSIGSIGATSFGGTSTISGSFGDLDAAAGNGLLQPSFSQSALSSADTSLADLGAGGAGTAGVLGGGPGGLGSGTRGPGAISGASSGTSSRMVSATSGVTAPERMGFGADLPDHQLMNNRVSTSGGAGAGEGQAMPPMSGGGGGAGGGAGAGSFHSGKKAYVTEEEDAWGTGKKTASGVLGR